MSLETPIRLFREGLGNIQYSEPPGAGAGFISIKGARNGLTIDTGKFVVLGQDVGQAGNPSALLNDREIIQGGHAIAFVEMANNAVDFIHLFDGDAPFHQQGSGNIGQNFNILEPFNYGVTYPSAYAPGGTTTMGRWLCGYGVGDSGEGPSGMPDVVLQLAAYNINATNARIDSSDGAYRLGFEGNFLNSLGIVQPCFEFHLPEAIRYDGTRQRLNSFYFGKLTGNTLWQSVISEHEYQSPITNSVILVIKDFQGGGGNAEIQFVGDPAFGFSGQIHWINQNSSTETKLLDSGGNLFIGNATDFNQFFEQNGNAHLSMTQAASVFFNGATTIGLDQLTGTTPAPEAILEIKNGNFNKGFVLPRMTTVQKLAISGGTPSVPIMVYDTTINQVSYYNGTTWVNL